MPFGSGSKSAQTPSESSQTAKSNRDPNNDNHAASMELAGKIAGLAAGNYQIWHKWRKVGEEYITGTPHHSQLFVTTTGGGALFNFGLFGDEYGEVVFVEDRDDREGNEYKTSSSYKPNPLTVTKTQLAQAFQTVRLKCGKDYKLLHNNCQKFARLMMQTLGAKHNRHLFHP